MIKAPWWVWLSLLACAAVSLYSVFERHRVEQSNRMVGIMMEMVDVEAVAAAKGMSRADVLAHLKERGLVGVAVSEETIGDLVKRGRLVLDTDGRSLTIRAVGDEASRWSPPDAGDPRYLGFQYQPDLYHLDRTAKALARRGLFDLGTVNVPFGTRYPTSISVDRNKVVDVSMIPVGIDPRAAQEAKDAGLVVVARHFNEVGVDAARIVRTLRDSEKFGASAFLIGGDQALGNREMLEVTAEALRELEMSYLSPEFVAVGGDSYLRKSLVKRALRLHSVSQQEAEQLSERELFERFTKAFRERSVQWLLLRPTSKASADPLQQVSETLFGLKTALTKVGGSVGPPRPYEPSTVDDRIVGSIALLALPVVAWALFSSFGFNVFSVLVAVGALALAGASLVGEQRGLASLMVAVGVPLAGFLAVVPDQTVEAARRRWYPFLGYVVMSLFSLVAGLAVAGTLVGNEYTLRVEQFPGVKIALFVPILVVGWVLLRRQGPLSEVLGRPVSWLAAAVTLLGLAAIAMLALRSGNENPSAVSSLELQVRSLLDNLLHVRPRTKEVVFGHPALVIGLCLVALRPQARGWAALFLLAGMVGQTSIVNTMCHLHTPALLSLTRIGVGLGLGGIIGVLCWLVARRLAPSVETTD